MTSDSAENKLLTYAITDRLQLTGESLSGYASRAFAAGLDYLQIREKDLNDRDLLALVKEISAIDTNRTTKLLVNDRVDIALAGGADGVHLGGHSVPPAEVRKIVPEGFIIGVSTHSTAEIRAAVEGGADFITYGPVFYTETKARYGPPVGIPALEAVLERFDMPVFPLGGITPGNLPELFELPISGIASISLFQKAENLAKMVSRINKRL